MQSLDLYLKLGFDHILDLAGFDHMLFLVALCAVYRLDQWKRLLVLVTAFTIGHSVTLALSAFGTITIPSEIIEFLIPTTILITALQNVVNRPSSESATGMRKHYAMALFFGFIHGMGFSNYFRALLMSDDNITLPLLGFNLGIEIGQLVIVGIIVSIAYALNRVLAVKQRDWNLFVSGAAAGMAFLLMTETKFW